MRYRRLTFRHEVVMRSAQAWPFGEVWQSERLRLLVQPRWRPDADVYETASAVEMIVDLSGVEEDDFEVQLFEDVVVVEGERRLASSQERAVYHVAAIRQGPFRVDLPLPAAVDLDGVQARYDRGLLRITLPRRAGAA